MHQTERGGERKKERGTHSGEVGRIELLTMRIFIKISISCWFISRYLFLKLGSAKGTTFVFFEVDTIRYSRPHVRNKIFLQEKLLLAKQVSVFTS